MNTSESALDLGIAHRLRRSRGRSGRVIPASTKVTLEEQKELENAAKAKGLAFSEWAREVLLREARSGVSDRAVFTELFALRLQLSMTLRPMFLGRKGSEDEYAQILAEAKDRKHEMASDVLKQYQVQPKGDQ